MWVHGNRNVIFVKEIHADFEEQHKNRFLVCSLVCTWPKYIITSEFLYERNILSKIFEPLLPAHIPSLQIPIWLNSLLRPLQCFFESNLREHVHEGTIPDGRRPIQAFQLDRITKEEKNTNTRSPRMSSTSEAIQSTKQKPQSAWYGIFLHYKNKIKTM